MDNQRRQFAYLVGGLWTLNLVAGMLPQLHYQPSEAVNGIMMLVCGSMFVSSRSEDNDKKKDDR